jgi:hypothetical protein
MAPPDDQCHEVHRCHDVCCRLCTGGCLHGNYLRNSPTAGQGDPLHDAQPHYLHDPGKRAADPGGLRYGLRPRHHDPDSDSAAKSFGLDPIYFGVVMVANLCIGLATPPVGNVLYCGVSLSKVKLSDLIKASLPFIGVMYLVLLLITMFPELIMFVPKAMG